MICLGGAFVQLNRGAKRKPQDESMPNMTKRITTSVLLVGALIVTPSAAAVAGRAR
jgi:hypothetical protein